MGYKSYHSLSVFTDQGEEYEWEIIDKLRSKYEGAYYALTDKGEAENEYTWSKQDEHMCKFSLQYPDIMFSISGEGQQTNDTWITYYKNGKMQHCPAIVTYDDYDESKLKPYETITNS